MCSCERYAYWVNKTRTRLIKKRPLFNFEFLSTLDAIQSVSCSAKRDHWADLFDWRDLFFLHTFPLDQITGFARPWFTPLYGRQLGCHSDLFFWTKKNINWNDKTLIWCICNCQVLHSLGTLRVPSFRPPKGMVLPFLPFLVGACGTQVVGFLSKVLLLLCPVYPYPTPPPPPLALALVYPYPTPPFALAGVTMPEMAGADADMAANKT